MQRSRHPGQQRAQPSPALARRTHLCQLFLRLCLLRLVLLCQLFHALGGGGRRRRRAAAGAGRLPRRRQAVAQVGRQAVPLLNSILQLAAQRRQLALVARHLAAERRTRQQGQRGAAGSARRLCCSPRRRLGARSAPDAGQPRKASIRASQDSKHAAPGPAGPWLSPAAHPPPPAAPAQSPPPCPAARPPAAALRAARAGGGGRVWSAVPWGRQAGSSIFMGASATASRAGGKAAGTRVEAARRPARRAPGCEGPKREARRRRWPMSSPSSWVCFCSGAWQRGAQ